MLFPVNFSSSMIDDTYKCEMSFFRQYCQRLTLGNEHRSSDLIAGGHFAKGCEIVRKSYYSKGLSIDDSIELGYNHILEAEDTGCDIKSNVRLALTLRRHFIRHPLDSDLTPIKLSNGEYAIEYGFTIDLGIPHPEIEGQNICYKGKLDGLYEQTFRGNRIRTIVVDEKTSKSVYYLKGTKIVDLVKEEELYRTSHQFVSYHWAARLLGVKPETTIVYKVPILKEHAPSFALEVPINDFMIEMWYTALVRKIKELIFKYLELKHGKEYAYHYFTPALNQYTCNSFGKPCFFTAGCRSSDGEQILKSMYKQMIWDGDKKVMIPLDIYKQQVGVVSG